MNDRHYKVTWWLGPKNKLTTFAWARNVPEAIERSRKNNLIERPDLELRVTDVEVSLT